MQTPPAVQKHGILGMGGDITTEKRLFYSLDQESCMY